MYSNSAATVSIWQVLDTAFYVVRVVGDDESVDGGSTVLRLQGSVVIDHEDDARIWLREVLLGAVETL